MAEQTPLKKLEELIPQLKKDFRFAQVYTLKTKGDSEQPSPLREYFSDRLEVLRQRVSSQGCKLWCTEERSQEGLPLDILTIGSGENAIKVQSFIEYESGLPYKCSKSFTLDRGEQ